MNVIEALIAEQQKLTAVDAFADAHDAGRATGSRWHDLIPAASPGPGQQYAFEVDLDRCTACKSCVTGCHSENGLDPGEVWRTVGLLHGGVGRSATLQTVTTSCHHCLDPACMNGCPVRAYEKDPVSGIVRHLDDVCIGCQYCTFTCPYDAPKYNPARGIVRKCDMCESKLAQDIAPACVRACPNEAIHIGLVDRAQLVEEAEANVFLPGADQPGHTVPTTRYGTEQNVPKNLLPADWFAVSPEKAHAPLIVMLVLTQLAAGALAADRWLVGTAALTAGSARLALVLGLAALGASFLHLGRPLRAWRVLVGLRTSWLSREILGFSLFAALAFLHAIKPSVWLGSAAAAVGLLSVFASVMVYAVTRRAFWQLPWSLVRFFGTTAVLGCATVLLVAAIGGNQDVARLAATAFAMSGLVKLSCELSLFRHLADRLHSPWKRSAILMRGDLGNVSLFRFFTGGAAVTIVALVLFAGGSFAPVLAGLIFLAALAGELAERYLFFAASTAPRMPGGVAS